MDVADFNLVSPASIARWRLKPLSVIRRVTPINSALCRWGASNDPGLVRRSSAVASDRGNGSRHGPALARGHAGPSSGSRNRRHRPSHVHHRHRLDLRRAADVVHRGLVRGRRWPPSSSTGLRRWRLLLYLMGTPQRRRNRRSARRVKQRARAHERDAGLSDRARHGGLASGPAEQPRPARLDAGSSAPQPDDAGHAAAYAVAAVAPEAFTVRDRAGVERATLHRRRGACQPLPGERRQGPPTICRGARLA